MFAVEMKSEEIVSRAIHFNATDIHIVPSSRVSSIQLKVNSALLTYAKLQNSEAEKLISHFKFRAKMDIGERRRPQNGSLTVKIGSEQVNLRISTLPTLPHESLAIRLLPQNEVISLDQLSLFKNQLFQLRSLMKKAHGLLLVSGPTGSGKTTTIYSLLYDNCLEGRRIITIEDPIEKQTNKFIQMEINKKAGMTYVEALKATLRHDPDIIMVGEIRDKKTAQIAIRAAMTGHLVVSTIHASNSSGCIGRLKEFGIAEIDIEETVIGLVSQRLLKLNCSDCLSICSPYCALYSKKRRQAAVYEIVAGEHLKKLLKNHDKDAGFQTIESLIKKSIALGFVHETEFERWLN